MARYPEYDGSFSYAIRRGRKEVHISLSQKLHTKQVLTLKVKSTNNLYIMLDKAIDDSSSDETDDEEVQEVTVLLFFYL